MSEFKLISPLLDGMIVEKEFPEQNGRTNYTLRKKDSEERYTLNRISVPASDSQVRALILSGAYPSEEAVHEYYGKVVADISQELEKGKMLAASGCYSAPIGYQSVVKEEGIGYDVYILYPQYVPLSVLLSENAISNLRAINLGIDLCDAACACRDAGYLFENINPENIFLTKKGSFLVGGLGLVSLEDLRYACVPEEYIGAYSAPELSDITAPLNLTVDLYSIGMVLYRVYNGNHGPFEDENTGEGMADKLRMTGKQLPTPLFADYELASIILKACSFTQEDRYQSPEQFKQALILYMQRNEVSDSLIVPPIVASPEPLENLGAFEEEPAEDEPIRMTNAEDLDETFRASFAPDLSGAGTEDDIDETLVAAEAAILLQQTSDPEEVSPAEVAEEDSGKETPVEEASVEADPEESPAQEDQTEEAAPAEEKDPDQLDLDELLASISEDDLTAQEEEGEKEEAAEPADEAPALTMSYETSPSSQDHTYVDARSQSLPKDPQQKPTSNLPKLLIILGLLLAIGIVAFFLVSQIFVEAQEMRLLSCSPEEIVLELVTEDSQSSFALTCTDSHGNRYPSTVDGDIYTFSELDEMTTYTININAAGLHRLTNASIDEHKVTTPEATKISDLTVTRGEEEGQVMLSFHHEGPTPGQWQLSYTNADGSDSGIYHFDGNAYLVDGLKLNETYTFELECSEGFYLSGTCSVTYELLPFVYAENLNISDITGQTVTVTWETGENLPEEWTITCEAAGIEAITESVTETTCKLTLPDLTRDYIISVDARGMDAPQQLKLPADPIVVEGLSATVNEDGTVTLTWNTPAGSPDGGWYISYNTVGSVHTPYMLNAEDEPIRENSVTLEYLIPNAEYEIALNLSEADASQQIFGETSVLLKTGEALIFDDFGLTPKAPYDTSLGFLSLWKLPEKEDWKYTDLIDNRSVFAIAEKIAVCIQVNGVNASEEEVHLQYAIRNSEGTVVNDIFTVLPWDNMWYSRHHASEIPLPAAEGEDSVPGDYTLEIYVNGKLLASAKFTIE